MNPLCSLRLRDKNLKYIFAFTRRCRATTLPSTQRMRGEKNHGQLWRTPRKESFQRANGMARRFEEPSQVRYFFQRISTFSSFPPLVAILWYKGYIKNLRCCRRPGEYQKFFHSPERQRKSTGKARPYFVHEIPLPLFSLLLLSRDDT